MYFYRIIFEFVEQTGHQGSSCKIIAEAINQKETNSISIRFINIRVDLTSYKPLFDEEGKPLGKEMKIEKGVVKEFRKSLVLGDAEIGYSVSLHEKARFRLEVEEYPLPLFFLDIAQESVKEK